MTLGIISQARTTSTRLPGKVLLHAGGRTMLDHHLDRLTRLNPNHPVYIATTTNDTDDPIVDLAHARGIEIFRGSEEDVLSRFMGCAEAFGLDAVVRVTSDCPLIDPALVAQGIEWFLAANDPWTYVSNALTRTFPRGMDYEVFSVQALRQAHEHAIEPYQREHVTPYLYERRDPRTTLVPLTRTPDKSSYRLTLDTQDDFTLLKTLIEDHNAATLDTDAIITILDANPHLAAINHHIEQKKLEVDSAH